MIYSWKELFNHLWLFWRRPIAVWSRLHEMRASSMTSSNLVGVHGSSLSVALDAFAQCERSLYENVARYLRGAWLCSASRCLDYWAHWRYFWSNDKILAVADFKRDKCGDEDVVFWEAFRFVYLSLLPHLVYSCATSDCFLYGGFACNHE